MDKRLHLFVKGLVQGVFYRSGTKRKAIELELRGYVKNLEDGDVEVVAEGPEENLKLLLDWCKKGPESAEVQDIEVKWEQFKGEYPTFSVKY